MPATYEQLLEDLRLVWDEDRSAWLSPTGTTTHTLPFRVLVTAAVDYARPIIEDGLGLDDDGDPYEDFSDLLPIVDQALDLPGTAPMNDAQIDAVATVAALGVEYLANSGYAEDPFDEYAPVARALAGMNDRAFTHALAHTFNRRWQD